MDLSLQTVQLTCSTVDAIADVLPQETHTFTGHAFIYHLLTTSEFFLSCLLFMFLVSCNSIFMHSITASLKSVFSIIAKVALSL